MNADKQFQEISSRVVQSKAKNEALPMVDNRQMAAIQAKMIEAMQMQEDDDDLLQGKFTSQMQEDDDLLQGKFVGQMQEDEDELLQGKFAAQMQEDEDELLQGKFPAQMQEDDDELLQGKFDTVQRKQESNTTGMPDEVKSQMENSFHRDFSSVHVEPDSQEAVDVGALAFTQDNSIKFAPGQFKTDSKEGLELIGHELAHVDQQDKNQVQATTQVAGMPVNDDVALETDADVKGAKAALGQSVS